YNNPFQRREIPEAQEETPGAGIRVNGDDDNVNSTPDRNDTAVNNENDLIEVVLDAAPPAPSSGFKYVLKRSASNIKVWNSQTKGTAWLDANDETNLTFSTTPMTVWVENPNGGDADLELVARSGSTDVCSDKIHFCDFTTVVIALGGLNQVPADPADANNGIFQLAIDLYEDGYDAHMYNENAVTLDGQGVPCEEVVSAIRNRGVTRVVIYGYSRGGGATFDMADELNDNSAAIGHFTLSLTAYIDAVTSLSAAQENRRPTDSALHINYFQEGVLWPLNDPFYDNGLDGGPIDNPAPGDPPEVNVDAAGQTITHYVIDEHPPALNAIRNGVLALPR
ncbi:MAG: hypothetical protein QME60_04750, partial [Verrucomicrobiota bacterium]|nr:hypothetical protein [Verrucomicrobiota bacterium]